MLGNIPYMMELLTGINFGGYYPESLESADLANTGRFKCLCIGSKLSV